MIQATTTDQPVVAQVTEESIISISQHSIKTGADCIWCADIKGIKVQQEFT